MRKPRNPRRERRNPVDARRFRADGASQDLVALPVESPVMASFESDGTLSIETPVLAAAGSRRAFMLRLVFSAEAVDAFLRALDAFDRAGSPCEAGIARTRRH